MIDVNNYPILKSAVCELRDTSKTTHKGIAYMSQSTLKVVHFDEVKNQFVKDWDLKKDEDDGPASNDALYVCTVEDKMFFIEFKSGENQTKTLSQARRKIYDSLLILTEIIEKGISKIRKNLNYILVHGDSMATLDNIIGGKAKEKSKLEQVLDQLQKEFEGLYFKEVHIVSKDEFDIGFVKKWELQAQSQ